MDNNTWPDGYRNSISQDKHTKWNTQNYPGTRQLCCICEEPTERCEEDSIYSESGEEGPFCVECWRSHNEYNSEE